jgi:hypothetical protein
MEPAVTVEPPVTVELATAPAIMIPVAAEPAPVPASAVVTPPIVTAAVVAVIPGTGADKHAPNEPIRAVVAVRRTSIGVITIIAISTYRRWAIVSRAATNAYHHSLCMRERRAKEANPE